MKTSMKWTGDMRFDGECGGHPVPMDAKAPIGGGRAPTPKELVILGLGGCTAMDVIALLKKHKQLPTSFLVDVDVATSSGGHPVVFTEGTVSFKVSGTVDEAVLLESVKLSQTKFCGVSAMLSKVFPIRYTVELNGRQIGEGRAEFPG